MTNYVCMNNRRKREREDNQIYTLILLFGNINCEIQLLKKKSVYLYISFRNSNLCFQVLNCYLKVLYGPLIPPHNTNDSNRLFISILPFLYYLMTFDFLKSPQSSKQCVGLLVNTGFALQAGHQLEIFKKIILRPFRLRRFLAKTKRI